MNLHAKINELNPILAGYPHILYVIGKDEDIDAFGSAGCDVADAILCIERIIRKFNLDPLTVAIAIDVSLTENARQN